MSMKTSLLVMMVVSVHLGLVKAGFRCTLGNWACTASCVTLGQTSGICDGDGECNCSERSISLSDFNALLPSRCQLGESFCKGTCQATGRVTGKCAEVNGAKDCQCSDNFLSASQFALCAAESTCRLDCQRRGLASGECEGWNCQCVSNNGETVASDTAEVQ